MNYPYIFIQYLSIDSFKQYEQVSWEFHPKLNIITGNNGVGKTNLLDAIYYCLFLKSYFNTNNHYNFPFNNQEIKLTTQLELSNYSYKINVHIVKDGEKKIALNELLINKQTEIAGKYPIIFIEPNDIELLHGGAELRRKLLDSTLGISDANYLFCLLKYQKLLKQKNALLKNEVIDTRLLQVYNEQLIELNRVIYTARTQFITAFVPVFNECYQHIFDGNEPIDILYESIFNNNDINTKIIEDSKDEIVAQRCLYGIHTDDLHFMLYNVVAKKIASQGQQKTFVIALKFAIYNYITKHCKKLPVLFLDDIFDKLDIHRIKKILSLTLQDTFGQVFISYTDADRLISLLKEIDCTDFKHIQLDENR